MLDFTVTVTFTVARSCHGYGMREHEWRGPGMGNLLKQCPLIERHDGSRHFKFTST
jgi:hypothetical protein